MPENKLICEIVFSNFSVSILFQILNNFFHFELIKMLNECFRFNFELNHFCVQFNVWMNNQKVSKRAIAGGSQMAQLGWRGGWHSGPAEQQADIRKKWDLCRKETARPDWVGFTFNPGIHSISNKTQALEYWQQIIVHTKMDVFKCKNL